MEYLHIALLFRVSVAAISSGRTRLAIFDETTSNTALRLPAAELAALCRENGVLSLVDAAHSAASNPDGSANIASLREADFVAGNMHKWACAPRGSGFLFARNDLQDMLEPPLISHGYGAGFHSNFIWYTRTRFACQVG